MPGARAVFLNGDLTLVNSLWFSPSLDSWVERNFLSGFTVFDLGPFVRISLAFFVLWGSPGA